MLLCTKTHFIKSLDGLLSGGEGPGSTEERKKAGEEMKQMIRDCACDESGLLPGPVVMRWKARSFPEPVNERDSDFGAFSTMVDGITPQPGQRIIYVDGGFDLFSSGHIEFLRQVVKREDQLGHNSGWFEKAASETRVERTGKDYGPAFVIAGIHDDTVINYWKGVNYPIMNIFERGLCVLQCRVSFAPTPALCTYILFIQLNLFNQKYINSIIFSAPFIPTKAYLTQIPFGTPDAVYHGPTSFIPLTHDPYIEAKNMGIYEEIGDHDFQHVNAGEIVQRVLKSREMYEARQRMKGVKAVVEEAVQKREEMERAAAERERERKRATQET